MFSRPCRTDFPWAALAICLIAAALSPAANLITQRSCRHKETGDQREFLDRRRPGMAPDACCSCTVGSGGPAIRSSVLLIQLRKQQVSIEYVRVRKSDGSVVETPASTALDVATAVAAVAPTYSDLRQKQIPVKGLGLGDVLEYSFQSSQRKPEVPGQFWYDDVFVDDAVSLIKLSKSEFRKTNTFRCPVRT